MHARGIPSHGIVERQDPSRESGLHLAFKPRAQYFSLCRIALLFQCDSQLELKNRDSGKKLLYERVLLVASLSVV